MRTNPVARWSSLARELAGTGVLATVLVVLFWRVLFAGEVLLPTDFFATWLPWSDSETAPPVRNYLIQDSVDQSFPNQSYVASRLQQGSLPLWNPLVFGGIPVLGGAWSMVWNPLNLLYLLMDTMTAWHAALFVQLLLSGSFSMLLARVLGASRPAAVLAGLVFMISGFMSVWLSFYFMVASVVWLPLVLALFELATRRRSLIMALGSGVALGFLFLASGIQPAMACVLAYLAYCAGKTLQVQRDAGWRASLRIVSYACLALVIALAIGAARIAPVIEYASEGNRLMSLQSIIDWPRYLPDRLRTVPLLATFLLPDIAGNPVSGPFVHATVYTGLFGWNYQFFQGYAGVLPLALALVGLLKHGLKRSAPLVAIVLIAVPGAIFTPIYLFVYQHIFFAYVLAIAQLSAMGLDVLASRRTDRWARAAGRWLGLLGLAIVALVALMNLVARAGHGVFIGALREYVSTHRSPEATQSVEFWYGRLDQVYQVVLIDHLSPWNAAVATPSLLLLSGGALLILRARGRLVGPTFQRAAVALVAVDLLVFAFGYLTFGNRSLAYPDHPTIGFLQGALGLNRVAIIQDWDTQVLPPGVPMVYGLADVGGYESIYWRRCLQLMSPLRDPGTMIQKGVWGHVDRNLMSMFGVKYVVSSPNWVPDEDWLQLAVDGSVRIWENPFHLPKAWFVSDVRIERAAEEALNAVRSPEFDPARMAVVEPGIDTPPDGLPSSGTGQGVVRVSRYEPERLEIQVESEADGLVVVGDNWGPGWHAMVDGSPTPIYRTNYVLRGVPVPRGSHSVVMSYEPLSVRIGLLVGVATLAAVACLIGIRHATASRARTDLRRGTSSIVGAQ